MISFDLPPEQQSLAEDILAGSAGLIQQHLASL
jgi:hypothetical protein